MCLSVPLFCPYPQEATLWQWPRAVSAACDLVGAVGQMFVTPQNSYVEFFTPNVVELGPEVFVR